jgi:hypothetical protein
MASTARGHLGVVRSSESVPLTWAERMAGLDYSEDHSVHLPDHGASAVCNGHVAVVRARLCVVSERTVCQPEKRKVGSSILPLTTSSEQC